MKKNETPEPNTPGFKRYLTIVAAKEYYLSLINPHICNGEDGCRGVTGPNFMQRKGIRGLRINGEFVPVYLILYYLKTGKFVAKPKKLCGNKYCVNTDHYADKYSHVWLRKRLENDAFNDGFHILWCGATTHDGYGKFGIGKKTEYVHRLAYMLFHGPIPENMEVGHTCGVRHCMDPKHLILQTHEENMAQMKAEGRNSGVRASGENHGRGKLKEADVKDIRIAHSRGICNVELARQYKLIPQYVSRIVTGKAWAHVPNYDADGHEIHGFCMPLNDGPANITLPKIHNKQRPLQKPLDAYVAAPSKKDSITKEEDAQNNYPPGAKPSEHVLKKIYDRSEIGGQGHRIWYGPRWRDNGRPYFKHKGEPLLPQKELFAHEFGIRPLCLYKICRVESCISPECYTAKRPVENLRERLRGRIFVVVGCWLTDFPPGSKGYPVFTYDGKTMEVYRAVSLHVHGPTPKGLVIRHTCNNKLCVRPSHLQFGTQKENAQDRVLKRKKFPEIPILGGAKHGNARFSDETYFEVSKLKEAGVATATLLRKYGMARSTLAKMLNGSLRPGFGMTYKQCALWKGWKACLCRVGCCVYGEAAREPRIIPPNLPGNYDAGTAH